MSSPTKQGASPAQSSEEVVRTAEIQRWLSSIEQCLQDICTITGESKLNTEQKLKVSNISRKVMGGVSQLAVEYQSLKQKYISANNLISNLTEGKEISTQLEDLKEDLKRTVLSSAPAVSSTNVSFADMVRKSNNSFVRPPNTSSIVIFPTEKEKTSEDTKNLVQKLIKPGELKLHIRGMRKTRNGGVIISSENKEDLDKLKTSEQLKTSGLKIEETTKRRPRIILISVPSNTTESALFECLFRQNISDKHSNINFEQFLSSVKLSHKTGRKDSPFCNFVLEITSDLRKILLQQERVYIDWTSCPVKDYTLVTRCYKCQQYGHSAKYCREAETTCGHCGCGGHTIQDCPKSNEPAKCATCSRFNKPNAHKTGDDQCPARKIAEARYINSVDYEGA